MTEKRQEQPEHNANKIPLHADMEALRHKYLRHDKKFPHVWCPGCGNGIVLGSLIRAIDRLGTDKNDMVLASGIGCSSRLPVYVDLHTLHTTHGRALTFATGIKLARPQLTVMAVMGDGDATAIGGNHFIHAARRNLDLTAIIINNQIYGMTGGQHSPTTPYAATAATAVYGHIEQAFSIADLAVAAGASYVARGTVYHTQLLDRLIEEGVRHPGFSVIEIISNCHVQFGRRNKMRDAATMMRWFKDCAVPVEKFITRIAAERADHFAIGTLVDRTLPNYIDQYEKIRTAARSKKAG